MYVVAYVLEVIAWRAEVPVWAPLLLNAGQLATLMVLVWQLAAQMKASEDQKAADREQLENAIQQLGIAKEALIYQDPPVLSVDPLTLSADDEGNVYLSIRIRSLSQTPAVSALIRAELAGIAEEVSIESEGGRYYDFIDRDESKDLMPLNNLTVEKAKMLFASKVTVKFDAIFAGISGGKLRLCSRWVGWCMNDNRCTWQILESKTGKLSSFKESLEHGPITSFSRTVIGGPLDLG